MKKIIDGVLYDTVTMELIHEDDYGGEVYVIYKTDDGKYLAHKQTYDDRGVLKSEDLIDCTKEYLDAESWVDRVLNS